MPIYVLALRDHVTVSNVLLGHIITCVAKLGVLNGHKASSKWTLKILI